MHPQIRVRYTARDQCSHYNNIMAVIETEVRN